MGFFSSLRRDQKEAVILFQTGTFLEYFDLMLYVHMAVLLNELFFPKTDPHTTALLTAFAFCSTFVMRPFGALFLRHVGDRIGRKTAAIMSMMMVSTSCAIIATLPLYEQIGITAAWVITACRIVQGFSSVGGRIGVEIYLTENIKPPPQYTSIAFIALFAALGTMAALAVSSLVTISWYNWRVAFF